MALLSVLKGANWVFKAEPNSRPSNQILLLKEEEKGKEEAPI